MERDTIVAFEEYKEHLAEASKHRQVARWEDAFRELKSAEAFVDRCRQRVLWELGALERRLARFEKAKTYLEEAESITRVDELQRIHILGELAIVYQHLKPAQPYNALRASNIQYKDAKDLARKEWQNFNDNGRHEHEQRALVADALACRAIGNLGLSNYLQSQQTMNEKLLQKSILQFKERIRSAQEIQTALQRYSQHGDERGSDNTSLAGLIVQAHCWESIGYDRLTLALVANGEHGEALRCAKKSQQLTQQSKDPTVRAFSRFFYGYALLSNGNKDMAKERLNFRSSHPDMCTSTIVLCKEPLDIYPKYLREITELGLNIEHLDEHGYSALDYTVFNNSPEMMGVVLERLKQGNYQEAEKDDSKRAEIVERLTRESFLKKHYREVFQDYLRPKLMTGGMNCVQEVRNSYTNLLLTDEAKKEQFDELRVVSYSDFVRHRKLPHFTDGVAHKYSSIRKVRSENASNDCVIFFSYRWKHGSDGPDDARVTQYGEGTQYGRMCDALNLFLDNSSNGHRRTRERDSESLYIWLVSANH